MRKKIISRNVIVVFCLAAFLSGCGFMFGKFPAYFDENSYKSLTFAKAKILFLYDSFGKAEVDLDEIKSVRLDLARIYEYEKGKGAKNEATTKQVELIMEGFEDHVKDRLKKDKWDEFDLEDFSENIADYFDIAIKTESLKNRKWE